MLQEQHSPSLRQSWVVCLSAALFFFYEFIQMNMMGVLNATITQEFSLTATQIGFVSNSYLFADLLFLLPAGLILDRYSTRTVIILAMIASICGTTGFALSSNALSLTLFHGLSGAGNGFCFIACILLTTRWFPPKEHALVIGLIVTIAFMGGMLSQAPFSLVVDAIGWRGAVLTDAILGLICLCIIAWNVQDKPREVINRYSIHTQTPSDNLIQSIAQACREWRNWSCGIYTSLMNFPILVLDALWGGLYLSQLHHLSNTEATTLTMMIFIGSMIGCPVVGWVSDRLLMRRIPMIIGALLSLATMLSIMYIPGLHYSELLFLFFCLGLFTSTQILTYPILAQINPPQYTGTATAISSILIIGGAFIAQPLFGQLMEWHWAGTVVNNIRVYSASDFHLALLILPIGFVISLYLAWRLTGVDTEQELNNGIGSRYEIR